MIDYKNFRDKVDQAIQNNTGVLFKNFLSKEDTPNWNDLLSCLHEESKKEETKDLNEKEKAYGNVLMSDNIYLSSHLRDKREEYFPKLQKVLEEIRKHSSISMSLIGPKICIGPHLVDFHTDSWHAFALQCEGKAIWTLSSTKDIENSSYVEEFRPETGDLLFFPQGLWHRIDAQDSIRGGLQFNAQLLEKDN